MIVTVFTILFSARMAGLQEDNKSLKLSLSKVEAERKQAQERSNNLEKVYNKSHVRFLETYFTVFNWLNISFLDTTSAHRKRTTWRLT